jgi:propionyl-CoA carboxylase alpha chain
VLEKILIANRGEIAVRIARTCRRMGLRTVAVYSDADARSLHVEVCDEAVRLPGLTPAETYLQGAAVLEAVRRTGADAVHPGYGFLSEDAAFAREVVDAGVAWVGPPPAAIEAMGDKITAKRTMARAAVPLVPGETLDDPAAARDVGERVGYPLLVKASAGGGGRGMRIVEHAGEIEDAVASARREAASAFGDDRVFLERLLTRSRHVEVQVLADAHGNVVHLFERECSVQRRHQKILEEAPSPGIDAEVRVAMCEAAVAAARAIDYVGAGTVEFIVDETVQRRRREGAPVAPTEAFAFLEMNTRLQVEHPVTEETVRISTAAHDQRLDLVRWQLLVAAGRPLDFEQSQVRRHGHAIEARVYAEDPSRDYLPAPGTLHQVRWHTPAGVRVDTGVRDGDEVSPHYDPMLAKVIAAAPTRTEAAGLLAAALTAATLHGPTTNRDLLVATLRDDAFLAGATTTDFLDERPALRASPAAPSTEAADLAAAVAVVALARAARSTWMPAVPVGFTPGANVRNHRTVDVAGSEVAVAYRQLGGERWLTTVGERELLLEVRGAGENLEVEIAGHRLHVDVHVEPEPGTAGHRERRVEIVLPHGRVPVRLLPRFPEVGQLAGEGATLAPMPGTVVDVAVSPGDGVAAGDPLVVVEAMKMEHKVAAPFAGHVVEVRVATGDQVRADEVLVVVEPSDDGSRGPG